MNRQPEPELNLRPAIFIAICVGAVVWWTLVRLLATASSGGF